MADFVVLWTIAEDAVALDEIRVETGEEAWADSLENLLLS